MARGILSEYGRDTPKEEAPRARSGGVEKAKTLPYDPPKGPTGMMEEGPGIHGTVYPCGTQKCE